MILKYFRFFKTYPSTKKFTFILSEVSAKGGPLPDYKFKVFFSVLFSWFKNSYIYEYEKMHLSAKRKLGGESKF